MSATLVSLAVQVTTADEPAAGALADRLGLPLLAADDDDGRVTHVLAYREGRLCLSRREAGAPSPTCVDFLAGALEHRRRTSGKNRGIGQAVGVKKLNRPRVMDATAGLGRDAFILAALGCRVTMLERSPVVHALLEDGLRRAREQADAELVPVIERLSLAAEEARAVFRRILAGTEERPDVIYLDPMFPPRAKSAKVKKDIGALQEVLGVEEDFTGLLALARQCARYRVVVKRPGAKTGKGEARPDFQIPGKACHFDVYLPAGL